MLNFLLHSENRDIAHWPDERVKDWPLMDLAYPVGISLACASPRQLRSTFDRTDDILSALLLHIHALFSLDTMFQAPQCMNLSSPDVSAILQVLSNLSS